MKKYLLYTLFLLLIAGCNKKATQEDVTNNADKNTPLRSDSITMIAVMPTLECLPFFVAEEYNIFEREGVKVLLLNYDSQLDIDTALIRKAVDMAVTDTHHLAYLNSRKVEVFRLMPTDARWYLVANHSSRISNTKQLADKLVGISRYSTTEWLSDQAFNKLSVKYPIHRIQINSLPLRLNMVMGNEIDAAWLQEPQASAALLRGHKLISYNVEGADSTGVCVARNAWTKKHTEDITRLKVAYASAVDSINKNGLAYYKEVIAKYCGVEPEVADTLPAFRFRK